MWHVTWFICIRTNYDRFKNRKICQKITMSVLLKAFLVGYKLFPIKNSFFEVAFRKKIFFIAISIFVISKILCQLKIRHFRKNFETNHDRRNLFGQWFSLPNRLRSPVWTVHALLGPGMPAINWRYNWWLRNSWEVCLGVFLHLRQ